KSRTVSALPTAVTFPGMPNTRWWSFEDSRTNFGAIRPDPTDLAKLLLIEFGLVYANDWFIIPLVVDDGTLATVRGLAVTNVFGERTWVEPAVRGAQGPPFGDDWAMFTLSVAGSGSAQADLSLALLPTAEKVMEGPALDDVALVRDEMANMVWGVETVVPL